MTKNIEITDNIVRICSHINIPVEGELGHVGSVNDEKNGRILQAFGKHAHTLKKTGINALAILVGTAHGRYKKAPKLDIERISEIHKAVPAHLVLHGGSGVPDSEITAAINAGIRKINFGTDVCYSFLDKVF